MSEKPPSVTIQDTEMRTLSSSYIDQEYNIFVALPAGYADSEETYPALYTTDADLIFGTITQLTRLLAVGKERSPIGDRRNWVSHILDGNATVPRAGLYTGCVRGTFFGWR